MNSWSLYDAFMVFEQAEKEREMAGEQEEAPVSEVSEEQRLQGTESRMLRSATIMERMLNLNTFHEIAEDFRYYEDPSDELKVIRQSRSSSVIRRYQILADGRQCPFM